MTDNEIINKALALGFVKAAIIDVDKLVCVPEYRKYCEENLCGNYDKLPACPPQCGTVEELNAKIKGYQKALVLQTELLPIKKEMSEYLAGKRKHNQLTDALLAELDLCNPLVMSAGPWKQYSCMSAYAIDAEKMAAACNMICWGNDGKIRFFSSILF